MGRSGPMRADTAPPPPVMGPLYRKNQTNVCLSQCRAGARLGSERKPPRPHIAAQGPGVPSLWQAVLSFPSLYIKLVGTAGIDEVQRAQGSTPRNEVAAASTFHLADRLDQSKYEFFQVDISRGDTIPCAWPYCLPLAPLILILVACAMSTHTMAADTRASF